MPAHESNRTNTRGGDGTIEKVFVVWDVGDDDQAVDEAIALAPPTYKGLNRQSPRLSKLADGPQLWEVAFTYTSQTGKGSDPKGGGGEGEEEDPPEGIIEFDGSGGTHHITQSLKTVRNVGNGVGAIPDFKQAIGVVPHIPEVRGVDVPIPAGAITITKHIPEEDVDGARIRKWLKLIGKTNSLAYTIDGENFEPCELLFLNIRGSRRGRDDWEVTAWYLFEENQLQIPITPAMKIDKRGHEYLWVLYQADADATNFLQVPKAAYVEQIFNEADFLAELGF
jgi:hypothetical protein